MTKNRFLTHLRLLAAYNQKLKRMRRKKRTKNLLQKIKLK
jgi:hypothetical protein